MAQFSMGSGGAEGSTFRPNSVKAQNEQREFRQAVGGIALSPLGAVDDVFSSIQAPFTGLANTFGADVRPFELGLPELFGAGKETADIARNTGGAAAGLFAGFRLGPAAIRAGGFLEKSALKVGVSPKRARRMVVNEQRTKKLTNTLFLKDRKASTALATTGVPPVLRSGDVDFGERLSVLKAVKGQKTLDMTKDIIAGETAMALVASQNELLYGGFGFEDVLIGGAFAALPLGLGALQTGFISRDSLSRATTEGVEVWRSVVAEAQRQGKLDVTEPGFSQGYDTWTSAMFNAVNARKADEGLNSADDVLRPNLDNARSAAITGLAENVETLGKGRPLQTRAETAKEATGSAAQPTLEQRQAAVDSLVEFPQLSVALSKVLPIGGIEETAEALHAKIKTALKDPDKRHELEFWSDHQIMVRETDGTIVPAEGIRKGDADADKSLPFRTGVRQRDYRDFGSLELVPPKSMKPGDRNVRLKDNQDLEAEPDGVILRKGKAVTNKSQFSKVEEVTGIKALLEAADQNADTLQLGEAFTEVTPNDHWTKLAWISGKLEDGSLTTKQTGGVNSKQIQGEILNQRIENLRSLVDADKTPDMLASDVSKITGLPLHKRFGGDWTPAGEAVTSLAAQTNGKITAIGGIDEIAEAAADAYAGNYASSLRGQLVEDVKQILESKPSFNTRTRDSLVARKEIPASSPVAFVNRVTQGTPKEMSVQADVLSRVAVDYRKAVLSSPDGHWLVRAVTDTINKNEVATAGANKVTDLHSQSLKHNSGIPGLITTREHQASDSIPLQSAHIIATETDRTLDRGIQQVMQPLTEIAGKLERKGTDNVVTHAQYSAYDGAYSAGLRIKEPIQPGQVSLDLKNLQTRETIRRLLPNQFQRLMQSNDVKVFDVNRALLHGRYEPINFSEEASELLNAVHDLEYDRLAGANQARVVANRPPVRESLGHMPPKDFRDQHMKFFRDSKDGRIVGFVAAKTTGELETLTKNAQASNTNLVIADEITTQRYVEFFDDIYEGRMIDFRNPLAQTGRSKSLDLNTGVDVTGDLLRSHMEAIRDGYRRVGINTRKLMFEQAINFTKHAQEARGVNRSGSLKRSDQGKGPAHFGPEQEFNRIMEGDSSLPPEGIPQHLDNLLEAATPIIEPVIQVAAKSLGVIKETTRMSVSQQKIAEDLFNNSHTNNLFASIEDTFQRANIESPFSGADMQRRLQRLNKAASTALLRFLGFGHALLNVSSVLVTAPAVARRLVRDPGESEADFRARMGGIADYIDPGSNFITLSPTKLMGKAIAGAYDPSPEMQKAMQAASDRGFFEAKIMEELQRTLYAKLPTTKLGKFMDQMIGTPTDSNPRGGILTMVSDSSEVMARRISWSMGYKLSKSINANRALSDEDHYAFAHWYANQTIGNYDPKIKPDMYRGTVGIPAGLFQTFVVNYLQRVSNMLEKKEYKALFTQGVTQASMFGLSSIPGYQQLSTLIGGAKGDEPDLTDRIYQTYGKDMADLIYAGTLSNLIKVFPGDQDGIAFHDRGGIDVRPQIPTISNATDFPAFSALSSATQGIHQFIAEGLESGRIPSFQRAAELTSMYAPITGARSIAEGIMGYTVNKNNDVIIPDIYTASGALSLLLGGKTLDESRITDAIYQNGGLSRTKNERVKRMVNDAIARSRAAGEPMSPEEVARLEEQLSDYSNQPSRIVNNAQEKARIPRANRDADKFEGQPNPLPHLRLRDRRQLPVFEEEVD